MLKTLLSFIALFWAVLLLLTGVGLLSTFLSLRMTVEGFATQTIGLVMSSYFVGLVAGSLVCHRLVHRVGHIRAFAAFAALCTAAAMVHALWLSALAWALLRFITGMSITGLYMVIESWLNECTQPKERGRIFSVYMIMTYLGLGVGQFLLGVSEIHQPTHLLVVGILFSLCLIPVSVTRSIHPVPPERVQFDLRAIFRKAPLGLIGCLTAGILNSTLYAMGPIFAFRIGMPVSQISLFMGMIIISGLLLQYPVGFFSDFWDRNIVLGSLGIGASLLALSIVLLYEHSTILLFGLGILYGGIAFTVYPVAVAHSHDFFDPPDIVAVSSALIMSFGVGAIIGPSLAARFMAPPLGPSGMFLFIAVVGLLYGGTVFWFRLKRPERLAVEEPVPFMVARSTSPVSAVLDPRSEPSDVEAIERELFHKNEE